MNILVDTNIALYLFGGDEQISGVLDGQVVHASFVTELELLGYPGIAIEEEKLIHHFLDDCVVIDIPFVVSLSNHERNPKNDFLRVHKCFRQDRKHCRGTIGT